MQKIFLESSISSKLLTHKKLQLTQEILTKNVAILQKYLAIDTHRNSEILEKLIVNNSVVTDFYP